MYFGSSIVICYLLTALTPAVKCGEGETRVPFPFKSEQQAIAVITFSDTQRYELARPELNGDQTVFARAGSGEPISYLCPTDEKQDSYTVVKTTEDNAYKYHECEITPRVAMRLTTDHPLELVFPNWKVRQLGYEIREKPQQKRKGDYFQNLIGSLFTDKTNQPLIRAPTGPFVPLIWFVYDETELTTRFVKYIIWSGHPLSIETEYTQKYNKMSPVDGENMHIDELYTMNFFPNNKDYSLATWYSYTIHESHFKLGLMKRQLVPKDDLVMFTWKNAAFFDALTAPMWKTIRTKWDVVEQFVRRLANVLGRLEIYAGTAGIMEFEDDFHNLHKAYLSHPLNKKEIPVPAYFWKAVVSRDISLGVLIVMHNDPFGLNKVKICRDIGYEKSWLFYNNDSATGLIYSCDLTDENISKLFQGEGVQSKYLDLKHLRSELPKFFFDKILNNIYA